MQKWEVLFKTSDTGGILQILNDDVQLTPELNTSVL